MQAVHNTTMAITVPPPHVLRSQHNMQTDPSRADVENDAFGNNGGDWQAVDYWYNKVLDKSSPSANTANPSALGLIAFGYTTALLQVTYANPGSLRNVTACMRCTISMSVANMFLRQEICPGSQYPLDRGVRPLHHGGFCVVFWWPCSAAGRHVGVQTQQYVCSNSLVKLRYITPAHNLQLGFP